MGVFDNASAMYSDPKMAALAAAAGAFGQGAMPSRVPVPFGAIAGQAAQQAFQGAGQAQNYEMGRLNLQRAEAMQPNILAMIRNGFGGTTQGGASGDASGGAPSVADQQFQQAYSLAMMSGDMGKAAQVLQSWAEHNPTLAGAIKTKEADAGIIKDANGNIVRAGNAVGGNQNPPGLFNPAGSPPQTNVMPNAIPRVTPLSAPVAADGKPFLPKVSNLFTPDPTGTPKYHTENTETGVNQTKIFQDQDSKADQEMTSNIYSLKDEQFRLGELGKIYKDFQSGSVTALNPDLMNHLVALHIINDPSEIKNVSDAQAAVETHLMQTLKQIKDTNASMNGQPTRTFSPEVSEMLDKGASVKMQPSALWNVLGQAKGIVDYHMDLAKGWTQMGGLGNRQANGYTMRPSNYTQQFIQHHDIQDYMDSAQKQMGKFWGMAQPSANRPPLASILGGQ